MTAGGRGRRGAAWATVLTLAVGCGGAGAQAPGAAVAVEPRCSLVAGPGADAGREAVEARWAPTVRAMSEVLGASVQAPCEVRLHADLEAFLRANPLAAEMGGVVGGVRRDRRRADIVVAASDGGDWDAAVRREAARLLVLARSDGRLPEVWVVGTADYLAGRSPDRAAGVARLREGWSRGALPAWSDVSASDGAYLDPPVVRPMALSVLHFVVERQGLAGWLAVLDAVAEGSGWPAAAERGLARPLDVLESQWRSWLRGYLDGGWQGHALYAPDLALARASIAGGQPARAVAMLAPALPLVALDGPDGARAAESVLAAARATEGWQEALDGAARALAAGEYRLALTLAEGVGADGAASGPMRRLAGQLADRARMGAEARAGARAAAGLAGWRALEARALASAAERDLARLGNEAAAREAAAIVAAADRRLRPLGWSLIVVGFLVLARNALGRRRARQGA